MSKYIIDVGDAYIRHGLERTLTIPVRINEHEDHWMDTRIPVTPYTEPDIEKVREEAYRQGYDTGYGTKVNEFYEQGLSDAWAAAKKIAISEESGGLTCREMQRIFCTDETDEIFDMSASEAIEKIRQYEQEQEEIKVGDEVAFHHDDGRPDTVVVVTYIGQDGFIDGMDGRGTQYAHKNPKKWTKTGRHFPELVELLRKMMEE